MTTRVIGYLLAIILVFAVFQVRLVYNPVSQVNGYYNHGNLPCNAWERKENAPVAAIIYYRSGEPWLIHKFVNGKLNGISKEYDKTGKLIAIRIYKNNQLLKRRRVIGWW